jgi:arylsulfatase A
MRKNSPNIIMILTDDQGYGDLGCYGHELIETPNIDCLAAGGIRFTDFYAAAAWCVPSRYGLMTGMHPYRGGNLQNNILQMPERVTMADMLKSQGYQTALLGKWHLGMGEGSHPLDRGFDYFYGTAGSNDSPAPKGRIQNYELFKEATKTTFPVALYHNREIVEFPVDQSLFIQRYTREAKKIIERSSEHPFFIYLAHNMPHCPIFPSDDFRGKSKGGLYGDVIEELDWSVGEIVGSLKERGVFQDTIIIYMSDNGPWKMFKEFGGTSGALKGEKSTTWEGGPRIPAIISWHDTIPPAVCEQFLVNIDLYATLAHIIGAPDSATRGLDSMDASSVLLKGASSTRNEYLFMIHDKPSAFRCGDFKVHIRSISRTRDPHTGVAEEAVIHDPPLLFNLKKDIGEAKNLSMEFPELSIKMLQSLEKACDDLMVGER